MGQAGQTQHYGLNRIGPGDAMSNDAYKFGLSDRDLIDILLWLGAEGHHHTGEDGVANAPTDPLSLALDTSAGSIKAGKRMFYRYTLVDSRGLESAAGPETFINTPAPIAEPGAPTATVQTSGGTLLPGAYYYVLSAWDDANTLETRATGYVNIGIPVGSTVNKITLALPSLPAGAQGFNVYRRAPGEASYHFLAEIDMTIATPPSVYVDDGSIAEDCNRSLPNANRTHSQNSIVVTLPGTTPAVPPGYTWKLYRAEVTGSYANSFLKWVVEETSEGSGIITPTFTDLGYGTSAGQPPTAGAVINSPDKINFTDAAEIQGVTPPANIVFKETIEFAYAGILHTATGTFTWRCPYEEAYIVFVRASLGRTALAAGADDIIDVNKYNSQAATPTWGTIFTDQTKRPRITVGNRYSADKIPDIRTLVKNDELTVDIDQVGGAATPTDADLLVQIVIWHKDSTPTSIVFP